MKQETKLNILATLFILLIFCVFMAIDSSVEESKKRKEKQEMILKAAETRQLNEKEFNSLTLEKKLFLIYEKK